MERLAEGYPVPSVWVATSSSSRSLRHEFREHLPGVCLAVSLLLKEVLQALALENTGGEVLQFGDRHAAYTLFCPIRQRTKASFDLHADDLELAFEQSPFVLTSQDLVVEDIVKYWHLSIRLLQFTL